MNDFYLIHPKETIRELLETKGIIGAEFDKKLEELSKNEPTAILECEKEFGISKSFFINLWRNYENGRRKYEKSKLKKAK